MSDAKPVDELIEALENYGASESADLVRALRAELAALRARLAEAERLLDDAKHAPGPFALMTVEEWWTAYHAWYDAARAADSADEVPPCDCKKWEPCQAPLRSGCKRLSATVSADSADATDSTSDSNPATT